MRTLRVNLAALIGLSSLYIVSLLFGCASQSGTQPESDKSGQPPLTTISSVFTSETSDTIDVTISADAPLTFSSLKQPDPLAVVLYFPETTVAEAQVVQPVMAGLISNIVARQSNGQRTARVEIQLRGDAAYTAVQDGNSVLISFNRPEEGAQQALLVSGDEEAQGTPDPDETNRMEAEQQATGEAMQDQVPPMAQEPGQISPAVAAAQEKSPPVQINASQKTAWVNKIDFVGETDGKSTLMVGTTQAVDYRINKVTPQRIEIQLLNTKIPSYHQRPLITTRFNSAVDRVTPVQPDKSRSESLISIDMRESVPYFTEQTDNMLFVHFEASQIPPKPLAQANLPPWKRVLSGTQDGGTVDSPVAGATVPAAMSAYTPEAGMAGTSSESQTAIGNAVQQRLADEDAQIDAILGRRTRAFAGEKIALDFFETDIKNVFRILREVSGKNFAIDKDVSGQVTMTLDKPVPWDQVLDLVLRMNQLGMVEEGEIVRIATLETIKREEDLRKARLEAYRKAREEVKALEPLVTRYLPVSYSDANSEIMPHIKNILSKRGSVSVDGKNNQIIVTDTVKVVAQAAEIVKRIDKVTAQVVIEGRVVEVSETFSRELGIEWGTDYGPGVSNGLQIATDMAMNFPSQADSTIGISFSRLSGVPFVLNARLNAVETTGEGRILSSPKILTLDNKKAKIKQGVEYPYLERDSSGGSSVKFKNIDLLLEVTPHVTPDNRISMTIFITKNDVAGITDGVPSVSTNEAETELLVNDGDTIVIGGIIKATEASGQDAFPLLSKIPVVGWAFKNKSLQQQNNELLIFITPRIVQLEQVTLN